MFVQTLTQSFIEVVLTFHHLGRVAHFDLLQFLLSELTQKDFLAGLSRESLHDFLDLLLQTLLTFVLGPLTRQHHLSSSSFKDLFHVSNGISAFNFHLVGIQFLHFCLLQLVGWHVHQHGILPCRQFTSNQSCYELSLKIILIDGLLFFQSLDLLLLAFFLEFNSAEVINY